jgi:hypothetical protein
MVSASYVPLLALVLARWLGASPSAAANVGLVVAVMLMIFYGWSAGRAARVDGKRPTSTGAGEDRVIPDG